MVVERDLPAIKRAVASLLANAGDVLECFLIVTPARSSGQ
jgi:hypothetical protein